MIATSCGVPSELCLVKIATAALTCWAIEMTPLRGFDSTVLTERRHMGHYSLFGTPQTKLSSKHPVLTARASGPTTYSRFHLYPVFCSSPTCASTRQANWRAISSCEGGLL